LEQILSALTDYSQNILSTVTTPFDRLEYAKEHFGGKVFSRKDYILLHKNISTATASRDLKYAIEQNKLQKTGHKNQTLYKYPSST